MLESRVSVENENIVAWVDKDGVPWIEQPFSPQNNLPWVTEEDAKSWADAWIEEFNNRPEPTPL